MTEREALKLALEALEKYAHDFGSSDLSVKAMYVARNALAQPEQPKVRTGNCLRVGVCASEGHKIAPHRRWVGLTDEEIKECFQITPDQYLPTQIYKRIEAKLKEKNAEKN